MEESRHEREVRELREQMNLLAQTMAHMMQTQGVNHERGDSKGEDRSLKVEIADFDGSIDPEIYLEWERGIERYFEFKETPDDKKFKLAKLKLTKHAEVWLMGVQSQRQREGKAKISTWEKLKGKLRRKFVPSNYRQQLYVKWSSLQQGKRSVAEFMREFEKLCLDCDIGENDDLKMGRFMAGLNLELREKIEATPHVSFEEAYKLAMVFEGQKKRRASHFETSRVIGESSGTKEDGNTPSSISKPKEIATPKETWRRDFGKKDPKEVTCFKCQGKGHYKHECPKARAFTTREWE